MTTKKVILLFCTGLTFYTQCAEIEQEPKQLSVTIVNEVSDITDDIADIIINSKTKKDPEVTKAAVVKLITHIATITRAIIEHRKEKRLTRSAFHVTQDPDLIIDEEKIDNLATLVLKKVQAKSEE